MAIDEHGLTDVARAAMEIANTPEFDKKVEEQLQKYLAARVDAKGKVILSEAERKATDERKQQIKDAEKESAKRLDEKTDAADKHLHEVSKEISSQRKALNEFRSTFEPVQISSLSGVNLSLTDMRTSDRTKLGDIHDIVWEKTQLAIITSRGYALVIELNNDEAKKLATLIENHINLDKLTKKEGDKDVQ